MFDLKNVQLKMFNLKNVQFKKCSNLKMFRILKIIQIWKHWIFRSSNKAAEKTTKNHHRKQKNWPSINRKTIYEKTTGKPNRKVLDLPKTEKKQNTPNFIGPAQKGSKGARKLKIHHNERRIGITSLELGIQPGLSLGPMHMPVAEPLPL
jgi:hypothetical protein